MINDAFLMPDMNRSHQFFASELKMAFISNGLNDSRACGGGPPGAETPSG